MQQKCPGRIQTRIRNKLASQIRIWIRKKYFLITTLVFTNLARSSSRWGWGCSGWSRCGGPRWNPRSRWPWTHSHNKATSPQRRGLRKGWEGVQQLLSQLAAFALVINIVLLPPVLFIEYPPNPLYLLQRGDSSSLFSVHKRTFSLEQLLIAPVKLSRGSLSFYNYGSCTFLVK